MTYEEILGTIPGNENDKDLKKYLDETDVNLLFKILKMDKAKG